MAKAKIANPRWLWITALVVGAICTIGFVAMLLAPAAEAPSAPAVPERSGGRGFGAGVLVGLAGGIAIGYAIARHYARADHSSRNNP